MINFPIMAMAAKMLQRSQALALARPLHQIAEKRAMQSVTPLGSTNAGFGMPMSISDFAMPMSGYPMHRSQPSRSKLLMPEMPQTSVIPQLPQRPATSASTKPPTPLMELRPNLHAKLEGFNVGGSIKDRAVMQCTVGMLESGKLKSGDTLCLCTSGNAGRSLLYVQEQLAKKGVEVKVKIFMPKRYLTRDVPTVIAETEGVDTVKGDRESSFYSVPHPGDMSRFLHGLDGEFMECQEKMSTLAKEHGWATLDQHFDVNSMHAHQSTAEELIKQLPDITDVVCTTGTGGTAAGLRKYLPDHVNVHARPAKPGDIDGITDVRRYSNFCDVGLLEGFCNNFFDKNNSLDNVKELLTDYKITAGESSGAAFGLAKEISDANPNARVVFIAADGHSRVTGL